MEIPKQDVLSKDETVEFKDTCPGCNKSYGSDIEDHVQFTKLSCGHSLCAKCIEVQWCNSATNDAEIVTCEICHVEVKISPILDPSIDKTQDAGSLKLEMSAFLQKQINKALLDTEQTLPQNVQPFDPSVLNKINTAAYSPTVSRSQRLPTQTRQMQMTRSDISCCIPTEEPPVTSKSPQIELGDEFLKFMAQQDEEHLEQLLYTLGCSPIKGNTASFKGQKLQPSFHPSSDCHKCLLPESPTSSHPGRSRHLKNLGYSFCGPQKKFEKSRSAGRHISKQSDYPSLHGRSSSKFSKYRAFSRSLKFDTQNLETLSAVASIQDDLDSSMSETLLQPPQKPQGKKDTTNKPKSKRKSYTLPHKTEHKGEVKPDTRCVHVLPQTSGSDSESNSCDSQAAESKFGVLKKQVMPDGSNIEHLFLVPTDWLSNKVEVKIVPSESTSSQEQTMPTESLENNSSEIYTMANSVTRYENCIPAAQATCCEGTFVQSNQTNMDSSKTTDSIDILCTRMSLTSTDETEPAYKTNSMNTVTEPPNLSNIADAQKVFMNSRPDTDPNSLCRGRMTPKQDGPSVTEMKTKNAEPSEQMSEYDGVLISGNEPCVILMAKNLDCIDETVLTSQPEPPVNNELKTSSGAEQHLFLQQSQGNALATDGTITYTLSNDNDSVLSNNEVKRGRATDLWAAPSSNYASKGMTSKCQKQMFSPSAETYVAKDPMKLGTGRDLQSNVLLTSPTSANRYNKVTNSVNMGKTGTTSRNYTNSRMFSTFSDVSSASNSCSASNSYTSSESDFGSPPAFDNLDVLRIPSSFKQPADGNSTGKRSHKYGIPSQYAASRDCDQRWKKWRYTVADDSAEKTEFTNRNSQKSSSSCDFHSYLNEQTRNHDMQCFYRRLHPEYLLKELEKLVSSPNSKLELTVLLQKLSELHEIINLRSSGNSQMVFNDSLISCESEKDLFYGIMMSAASVISFVKAYQVTARNEGKINQNCMGLINFFDKIIRHGVILITKMLFGYNHLLYTHQENSVDKSACFQNQAATMNSPSVFRDKTENPGTITNLTPHDHEEMTQMTNQQSMAKFQKVMAYIKERQRSRGLNLRNENLAEDQSNTEMMSSNQNYGYVSTADISQADQDKGGESFRQMFTCRNEARPIIQESGMNSQPVSYAGIISTEPECHVRGVQYDDKTSQLENLAEMKSAECDGYVHDAKVMGMVSDVALNIEVGIASTSSPDSCQSDSAHIPLKTVSTPTAALSANIITSPNMNINLMQKQNKTTTRKPRTSKKWKTNTHPKISTIGNTLQFCSGQSEEPRVKKMKNERGKTNSKSSSNRSQKSGGDVSGRKRQMSVDSPGGYGEDLSLSKKIIKSQIEDDVSVEDSAKKSTNKSAVMKNRLALRRTSSRKRKKSQFSRPPYSSSSEEIIRPPRRRGFQHTDKCYKIFTTVFNHKRSDEFCNEILSEQKPDYYKVVKRGMWLNLIAQKLRQGIYQTLREFVDDFRLVFKNCRAYYPPDSEAYESGEICSQLFEQLLKEAFPDKSL